jgi:hypothetical protein
MSSTPSPVTEATAPFVPTTTPAIERANRLMSLRAHPGFLDVIRISQELVQSAIETCIDYPGWDKDQITVLKVRMQAAKEHHVLLLSKIEEAVQAGIAEGKALSTMLPPKTAEESIDQSDYVRQEMLKRFEEQDQRIAGSY